MPKLEPITEDELRALTLADLVDRMDTIRCRARAERYPQIRDPKVLDVVGIGRVADLMNTVAAQQMSEDLKRKLADATFRFLLQMDFEMAASGISNAFLQPADWSSLKYWINSAALAQYQIIAGRIALECFFDLIHIIDTGERMPGKKGKFKAFRGWVLKPGNPFKYFVGHILHAFQFDREHRQREVHGTSRFARAILRLQAPDTAELNIPNQLATVLLNVWSPLVSIMNGTRPSSISTFSSCEEFADKYFRSMADSTSFDSFLKKVLSGMTA
jgi:hypothetical protein